MTSCRHQEMAQLDVTEVSPHAREGAKERELGASSYVLSPSPCSSRSSSLSSTSLEQRVDQSHLLTKVRALRDKVVGLEGAVTGGRLAVSHVQETLAQMLEDHSTLASSVSATTAAMEVLNRDTGGRAARHIASSQTALSSELKVLAEQLSSLEQVLRSGRGLIFQPHPSQTGSSCSLITAANDNRNGSSPRLPDIYLTPSHPTVSAISPSDSASSSASSNPASSLSHFDPFTPETPSAPPTRESSGAHYRVSTTHTPHNWHTTMSTTHTPHNWHTTMSTTHTPHNWHTTTTDSPLSPRAVQVGGAHGHGSSSSVLQWLMSTSQHSTQDVGEKEEEDEEGGLLPSCERQGGEDGTAATAVSCSPLSPPPISSPCADSGISASNYSGQSLSSVPQPHQFSPPPLSVTMSDIEAMRAELAALKREIRDTSNWSPSLGHQSHTTPTVTSHSLPYSALSLAHTHTANFTQTRFCSADSSSTPVVPRPYHSVSRSGTSATPVPGVSSHSSHRRLFSSSQTSTLSRQQKPRLVDHSVQTLPVSTPNTHFRTELWNRTEPSFCSYSNSPLVLPQYQSPSLPPHFTPHLIIHTSSPSHHHTPTPSSLTRPHSHFTTWL